MRRQATPEPESTICYDLGRHLLHVHCDQQAWTVSVDGHWQEQRFASELEAWLAGVATADLLDRSPAVSPGDVTVMHPTRWTPAGAP